jgi:glycosyltransferase involved in cell wall biosynthesis
MPKLVTALLVRNEADKYLERVLTRCANFSDKVLVLDDNSTDGSDRIAWRLGCEVRRWTGETMWGTESPARAALWDWGAQEAGDGWLLVCDADMLLHGDPRPLTYTRQYNSWALCLYDMWGENVYRCDTYWQGHLHPRPWLFKPSAMGSEAPIWPERGIHTGHAPLNFPYQLGILDNRDYFYIHRAYDTPALRHAKYQQYMARAEQLSEFETAHVSSILDGMEHAGNPALRIAS